jgi:histidinol-phosphate/aromatic aminotransferase/cobyric acid decarboxylase-like protein
LEPAWEPAAAASPPAAAAASEDWALGTWVELSNARQRLRTQLTWVSPQQTLFLFTATDGSTQSMTRRMRDKLLAQGQLRREDPA